ncbi:glycosyltransferase family 2 protein [Planctomicrobium sp. SH668]|uniref:glycosyltransferase family 2 protein n=1 Tax=Planctomicrobium sp. SH668 TaxID=3448126 RepID=UPI003F5C0786
MHLSVITATHQRPSQLARTLEQFRTQCHSNLRCEHIVVSDGPDAVAAQVSKQWGASFVQLDSHRGDAGAYAKDAGIHAARGKYVCFWDDDNLYHPHAISALVATAWDHDIGVVQTQHRFRKAHGMVTLPRRWDGQFHAGDIDTMCICVKRELALTAKWGNGQPPPGTDYRWLQALSVKKPSIRFVPIVIGYHL